MSALCDRYENIDGRSVSQRRVHTVAAAAPLCCRPGPLLAGDPVPVPVEVGVVTGFAPVEGRDAGGAGNTATTAYDALDRPVKSTDSAPSTVTYAYGTAGHLKTLTDSVAGTFTGTYDADGTLVTQTLPGDHTLTVTTDPAGQETGRAHTTSDGTTVVSDNAGYTVDGHQSGHTRTDGSTTRTDYTYDSSGRLTKVADTAGSDCATRAYTFDVNSNRRALTASSDDCDSSTSDTTANTTTYTYDSANRLVDSGYAYDAFGRTTSGSTTLTSYTNDLLASETLGTSRNTWTLDAAGRLAVRTAQTQATDSTWTTRARSPTTRATRRTARPGPGPATPSAAMSGT